MLDIMDSNVNKVVTAKMMLSVTTPVASVYMVATMDLKQMMVIQTNTTVQKVSKAIGSISFE